MSKRGEKRAEGIFNALDLAKYLNYLHNNKYGRDISPLKLQKSLFFLFGEWGAFISRSSKENNGDWKGLNELDSYLFKEEIEAWLYGPVVREVYDNFSNEILREEEIFTSDDKKYVHQFIDDLADELFELSDFKLVEISHQMKCWINNFDERDDIHCTVIDKEDIINEFLLQV